MIDKSYFPVALATYDKYATEKQDTVDVLSRAVQIRTGGKPVQALSIGTGSGQVDLGIVTRICDRPHDATVHCVEPNPTYQEGLRKSDQKACGVAVLGSHFESVSCENRAYDFAIASHSIYYFQDKTAILHKIAQALKPDGVAVFVINGNYGIGDVFDYFFRLMKQDTLLPTYLAEDLERDLQTSFERVESLDILSRVSVAGVMAGTADGDAMLSLMVDYDVRQLEPQAKRSLVNFVDSIAEKKDGRADIIQHLRAFIARPRVPLTEAPAPAAAAPSNA